MLAYLKDKKDVGFFLSMQALMQTCRSVLHPDEEEDLITIVMMMMMMMWIKTSNGSDSQTSMMATTTIMTLLKETPVLKAFFSLKWTQSNAC